MAKRKLTNKLKEQIKSKPYSLKKSDLAGEALTYLNRVRGAKKAAKTKAQKKTYRSSKKKQEQAPAQLDDLIEAAARSKGMSLKQFKKKFPKEVKAFENSGTLFYIREVDNLKLDIKFMERGRLVFNVGKKVDRTTAIYYLTRLKNKVIETGITYDRVAVEHFYDGKKNLHLEIPIPSEYVHMHGMKFLDWLKEFYPTITFYLRSK